MNSLRMSQVAESLGVTHFGKDVSFSSVSTDTRLLQPKDLFVALQGPRFDGHNYINQALNQGAIGVMVSQAQAEEIPQIVVSDTRLGLGRLASLWRESFATPLVAVTGSNGKTTLKEMVAAILRQRGAVLSTKGNLNNDIGLPLTLLRLQDEEFAVVEMGANHAGEIGYLSNIARPDVAVINNAGAAHLEGFGDLDGVARAKGEILEGLGESGIAVLNRDDNYFPLWLQMAAGHQVISFGANSSADVWSDVFQVTTEWSDSGFHSCMQIASPIGEFAVKLKLAGRHNLLNALAAVAVAVAMNCSVEDIQTGLCSLEPVPGRMQLRSTASGVRIIDDTYNANPDSVLAAIEFLSAAPGRRWLVLGDLAELGREEKRLHEQLGRSAKQSGFSYLYAVGQISRFAAEQFGRGGRWFNHQDELLDVLTKELEAGDVVLVKGSRAAVMDRVVEQLLCGQGG